MSHIQAMYNHIQSLPKTHKVLVVKNNRVFIQKVTADSDEHALQMTKGVRAYGLLDKVFVL